MNEMCHVKWAMAYGRSSVNVIHVLAENVFFTASYDNMSFGHVQVLEGLFEY